MTTVHPGVLYSGLYQLVDWSIHLYIWVEAATRDVVKGSILKWLVTGRSLFFFSFLLSIFRRVCKVSLRLLREELGRQQVHPQRPALIGGEDRAQNIDGFMPVDDRGFEDMFWQWRITLYFYLMTFTNDSLVLAREECMGDSFDPFTFPTITI